MSFDEQMMMRCIQLAQLGQRDVAPNPMVGCVITRNETIIAESYHKFFGGLHAEPNAIEFIQNKEILKECTLYVNLEPCAHVGKTPACADTIVQHQFKKVVVGCRDSFSKVDGKGISMLRAAGIEVVVGVVEDSCRELNRRFFTLHEKKRPYVILKWAESKDGFIGNIHIPNQPISNAVSRQRTHLWRAQEQAILIGANTALVDNPTLTTRLVTGKNPQRFVIDLHQRTPITHHLVSDELPTTFFNFKGTFQRPNEIKNSVILQEGKVLDQVINHLFEQSIQSVIVEGGATTISHFIDAGIWDEARVFTSNQELKEGISAPPLRNAQLASSEFIRDGEHIDELTIYHNSTQLFR